ncbi:MAG: Dam family site-specific DNA-(adenine-N6)-methyltransferase [Chloroflexaceae bacterium]|nr:Dam family site-specific DNA-(adenine-N6)-methyltransferase [Chloroflexaceae bacterium]
MAAIQANLPPELQTGRVTRYVEPFLGGGAVFFWFASLYLDKIQEFFLADVNPELILIYQTLQSHSEPLIEHLTRIQADYLSLSQAQQKTFYYEVRSQLNAQRERINFKVFQEAWIERAAKLLFLNKTCFNGLFRVNSQGEFNVPQGKYKNPTICDADNLRNVAQLLQRAKICYCDFRNCEQWVNETTFVYFDPPYRPISKTASFTAYSQYNFDDVAQQRLADLFQRLDDKGARLMLSNSDPKNENPADNFFEIAYGNYTINRVEANRYINSNTQRRGKIHELLILNY